MRSVGPMKAAKCGYIIMSLLFCVLGAALLLRPGVSVRVIGRLLGIGMLVFGAIKLTGYLSRDLFRLAFQYFFTRSMARFSTMSTTWHPP